MVDLGLARDWPARYPRVSSWWERMQARAAFKAAYYANTRLSESMRIKPIAVA
jgi:glutathione S-transferase